MFLDRGEKTFDQKKIICFDQLTYHESLVSYFYLYHVVWHGDGGKMRGSVM